MNRGGVETWLLEILRHIDRDRFQMDFLVHTAEPCAFDQEIRSLGAHIIFCRNARKPWLYAGNFRRAIAAHGPYDIVHSHVHAYSGYVLRLARQATIRSRIAHSHTDTRPQRRRAGPLRRTYFALASREIRRHATAGLAASAQAGDSLFGDGWQLRPRSRVLYFGCDLTAFRQHVDRQAVRAELGFSTDDLVIGHAGRFCEPKNHDFWVDVAAAVARREPRARFLLLGDGPLRPAVEGKIARLGMRERFRLTGVRSDVPRLLLGAMDLMLFPSLWEGLPLAVVEAQAAGLPCVVSQAVPDEAAVVPALLRRLPLTDGPGLWAQAVLAAVCTRPCLSRLEALDHLERGPFNIRASVSHLEEIYQQQLREAA
jgi:glycosyltransferase involved in cell wall biosynthesis